MMVGRNHFKLENCSNWGMALLYALLVSGIILALFYYWFAIANRYLVFLYFHEMGLEVHETYPFGRVTTSRYWMSGLVACGAVMVFYITMNWIIGRGSRSYVPPDWWRVWIIAAVLMSILIPAITMGVNSPRLPSILAVLVTFITILSLAVGLVPGKIAARDPRRLLWLLLDGWGIALILWTSPYLFEYGPFSGAGHDLWIAIAALIAVLVGISWLIFGSIVQSWKNVLPETTIALLTAGGCVAYLMMPLIHYLFFSDRNRYISNSDNFFARGVILQSFVLVLVSAVVWGIRRIRLLLVVNKKKRPGST